jgi:hypothetical protein
MIGWDETVLNDIVDNLEINPRLIECMEKRLLQAAKDTRLQMDKEAELDEILQLEHWLSSRQYTRFSTSPQPLGESFFLSCK